MRIPKLIQVAMLAVVAGLGACSVMNKSETKSDLQQRAQSGDIDARYQLGEKYADASFSNEPEAIYWLCLAAKDGHVPAQMRLARLYEGDTGADTGIPGKEKLSNKGSAYFWYTAAASQGNDQALSSREILAASMDAAEIGNVKRKATRWQQAGCVKPS